ncbi:MAG TPA: histone deacetylase [Anaerolineae bacterium]|nr:histone deacetylase [Anaerolineae bacterium]
MTTQVVVVPAQGHDREHHPESGKRVPAVLSCLEAAGMWSMVSQREGVVATVEQVARVHRLKMIERVWEAVADGERNLDPDTYITNTSYEAALLAAGSCCALVDDVLMGAVTNGMALVRPPGHHAENGRSGGFCLFNNIAVAARHAQVAHGIKRVMILDFDVHHGNGTQDIFYDDASVLFISMHLYGRFFYPGTGRLQEKGRGKGEGYTINMPLPALVGDKGYEQLLTEVVEPKAEAFRPELILISAGYDAHWRDPLANGGLSLTGYSQMSQWLVTLANRLCDGKILFILEGGYLLDALAYGVLNSLYALLGQDKREDPLGKMPHREADISNLVRQMTQLHLIN